MKLSGNIISCLLSALLFLLITNNIALAQEESTKLYGYVSKTDYTELSATKEEEQNSGRPPLPSAFTADTQTTCE